MRMFFVTEELKLHSSTKCTHSLHNLHQTAGQSIRHLSPFMLGGGKKNRKNLVLKDLSLPSMVVEHMLTQEMRKLPNGVETTNKNQHSYN